LKNTSKKEKKVLSAFYSYHVMTVDENTFVLLWGP